MCAFDPQTFVVVDGEPKLELHEWWATTNNPAAPIGDFGGYDVYFGKKWLGCIRASECLLPEDRIRKLIVDRFVGEDGQAIADLLIEHRRQAAGVF